MEPIVLQEYESATLNLDLQDASFIANSELRRNIQIARSVSSNEYILNTQQYVGIVELPSGRLLEIKPKVPVQNLFYMLAIASGASPWIEQETAQLNEVSDILEPIATLFADEAEKLIVGGLHRTYQHTENNLQAIRGRINFREDLRLNQVMRHHTFCGFDELTLDIPENQAVYQTTNILNGWNFRSKKLKIQLSNLAQRLSELTPTTLTGNDVEIFTYNRMNEHYRPIHRLCRLLLDGASLSEHAGTHSTPAFIIDMNSLFENFVTQLLIELINPDFTVTRQMNLSLDENRQYRVIPDIVLKHQHRIALIADCKYKKLTEDKPRSSNNDMYQLLSYCTITESKQGVLIYPLHEVINETSSSIRNTDTVIRQVTIDLSGSIESLITESERFAQQLANLVVPTEEAA